MIAREGGRLIAKSFAIYAKTLIVLSNQSKRLFNSRRVSAVRKQDI